MLAQGRRSPFNGELSGQQIGVLASELRMGFLTFCNRRPQLAKSYLQFVKASHHSERALTGIIKNSGALSQAAPKELAEVTAELLIPKAEEEEKDRRHPFREAFGDRDLDFIPASPSQGPFLQLLAEENRDHVGLETPCSRAVNVDRNTLRAPDGGGSV
jgi:hypothetical protein